MSDVSIERAVGAGFSIVKRRPMAIVGWAALYLVFGVAPSILATAGVWPHLLAQAAHPGVSDPAAVAAISAASAWTPLLWLMTLVLMSVMYGAVYRAVLQPEDDRYGYLRLGRRELWVGLTILALLVVLAIGIAVVTGIMALIEETAPGIVTVLAMIAAAVGCSWLALRFSLAPPMAFDQRRFVFFESWRLTRGRGWRLFVIAAALVAIILAVELILVAPLTLAFAAGGGPEALAADPQPLARSAPWIAVGAAMLSLFVALIYAIGGAPWAEVYQQLRGPLASRPQP